MNEEVLSLKDQSNESGYALVTVLLIITIVTVLAFSFVGQSFNSTKQNKTVEEKYQSTALAEMGITYFKHIVENAYTSSKEDVKRKVLKKMNEDRDEFYSKEENKNKVWKPDLESYSSFAAEEMAKAINNMLSGRPYGETIDKEYFSFEIKNEQSGAFAKQSGNNIVIAFDSTGYVNKNGKKSTTLETKLTILGITFNFADDGDNNQQGGTIVIDFKMPTFEITPPNIAPNNNCTNIVVREDDVIYCKSNASFAGNNNLKENYIYAHGSITFSGNQNAIDKSNIYSGEKLIAQKNLKNIKNSTIEVEKNGAEFNSHLDLIKSKININGQTNFTNGHLLMDNDSEAFINGNLHINGKFTLDDDSFAHVNGTVDIKNGIDIKSNSGLLINGGLEARDHIVLDDDSLLYVNGSTKIAKNLTIKDGSNACVIGSMHVVGDINIEDSKSNLYIWGSLAGKIKGRNPIYLNSAQEVKEKCGSNINEEEIDPFFDWGELNQKIDYKY